MADRPARGLGRGLAALIDPTRTGTVLVELELDRIVANPRQPRTRFDSERLDDLASSIRQDGVVQPIVVRDLGGASYELIAGERRWRAARQAGLKTVPAIVRGADDDASLVLALVENVVREDLNVVDVARGYAALGDVLGLAPAKIAERVGKSRSAVANTLRLLELPDEVLSLLADGSLSEGHGRAILQAPDHGAQRALARRAVKEGLSVRQVEALGRAASAKRPAPRRPKEHPWLDEELANDAVDACYRAFGSPVRVTPQGAGVRIELAVASREELERLIARTGALGRPRG